MRDSLLITFGMALQALIAGTLARLKIITLSVGQQITAGILLLILCFFYLILVNLQEYINKIK